MFGALSLVFTVIFIGAVITNTVNFNKNNTLEKISFWTVFVSGAGLFIFFVLQLFQNLNEEFEYIITHSRLLTR